MRRFTYYEPESLKEAIALLEKNGETARLLAGGTDLIVEIKQEKKSPDHLVSLRRIPGLQEMDFSDGELCIGAMVTHRMIEKAELIRDKYSLLADAVDNLGSVQVRNVATIGGNICNAAPSADTAAPLVALGARLVVEGPAGERQIPIDEFFKGPGKTDLGAGEILRCIRIPALPQGAGSCYIKHARRKAMDLPLLGIAVIIVPDANMVCREARIALSLAGPKPFRAEQAEAFVTGKPLSEEVWKQAGEIAVGESNPRSSFRTTAAYRRKMIGTLIPRAAAVSLQRVNRAWMKG
ncbi:MAG: FAD binding domain-containing protein [Bacillota bacterium]